MPLSSDVFYLLHILPLCFFFTVVADTPYARVLTYTFFPANTLVEASTISSLPHVTNATLPMPTLSSSTPPLESFFSPLSLLPHCCALFYVVDFYWRPPPFCFVHVYPSLGLNYFVPLGLLTSLLGFNMQFTVFFAWVFYWRSLLI